MEDNLWIEEKIEIVETIDEALEKLGDKALFVVDEILLNRTPSLQVFLKGKEYQKLFASELTKNLDTVRLIYEFLFDHDAAELVAIGGGIIGDMAGFAAATFKRGIPLTLVPTTLLSMCDSSIGGKTGVNYKGVKNYIGSFKKPAKIVIAKDFLLTLPDKEIKSGLGEIIKCGLIDDRSILDTLKRDEFSLHQLPYLELITKSLKVKHKIIKEDFLDQGKRNILNFGHNIAHGLEGYFEGTLTHGEAVALGILVELKISEEKLSLDKEVFYLIEDIMKKYEMDTKLQIVDPEEVLYFIRKDKKNDSHLRFTLLKEVGSAVIKEAITEDEIKRNLESIMEL
ncbi:MAG: 3-dehydroquinate synthase family protein [Clostridiaceae bacterium]